MSVFLTGPERSQWVYLFAAIWGVSFGWTYPSQRVLFCTLIPKRQETEMMGLFVFFGQIFGWLPPIVFTLMNEQNVDMRWGLSVMPFFTSLALCCTVRMGNYDSAVAQVDQNSEDDTAAQEPSLTNAAEE